MELQVRNIEGQTVGKLEISDILLNEPMNNALVHQALVMYMANQRHGTASTKTRSMVSGGGRKPFAQKHTGRARQGSTRAPQFRGGGVVFGPHPRSYRQRMPKAMRRKALRCLLSAKAREENILLLDSLTLETPKTQDLRRILLNLGITEPALLVTPNKEQNLILSARNLPGVKTTLARLLNVKELLNYDRLVVTVEAIRQAEELWAKPIVRGDDPSSEGSRG